MAAANIHRSPIVKFKFNNKFKSPLIIIAKTPIKQETKPIILIKLNFLIKKNCLTKKIIF